MNAASIQRALESLQKEARDKTASAPPGPSDIKEVLDDLCRAMSVPEPLLQPPTLNEKRAAAEFRRDALLMGKILAGLDGLASLEK